MCGLDYCLDKRIDWLIHRFHGKRVGVEFMALPGLNQEADGVQAIVDKIRDRTEIPNLEVNVHQWNMDGWGGF